MNRMSRATRFWVLTTMGTLVLLVYLFSTAPMPLEADLGNRKTLSTQEALSLLAYENDITRTLFTKTIVGEGKKNGLRFDENWAEDDVVAGPLPALFLRLKAFSERASETAATDTASLRVLTLIAGAGSC